MLVILYAFYDLIVEWVRYLTKPIYLLILIKAIYWPKRSLRSGGTAFLTFVHWGFKLSHLSYGLDLRPKKLSGQD